MDQGALCQIELPWQVQTGRLRQVAPEEDCLFGIDDQLGMGIEYRPHQAGAGFGMPTDEKRSFADVVQIFFGD